MGSHTVPRDLVYQVWPVRVLPVGRLSPGGRVGQLLGVIGDVLLQEPYGFPTKIKKTEM